MEYNFRLNRVVTAAFTAPNRKPSLHNLPTPRQNVNTDYKVSRAQISPVRVASCRNIETVNDGSVTTSVTVAAVVETPEQQQQQQQSKGNVGVSSRRVASQNVALSNGNSINNNIGRLTPRSHMEQEKRIRREIANSNERRRMQSINAGFQSLRSLLPHHEGEKLSKVSLV